MKEKLEDFEFADCIEDICLGDKGLVLNCCICFDVDLLICKDCICYNFCIKNNKDKNENEVKKGGKWF